MTRTKSSYHTYPIRSCCQLFERLARINVVIECRSVRCLGNDTGADNPVTKWLAMEALARVARNQNFENLNNLLSFTLSRKILLRR